MINSIEARQLDVQVFLTQAKWGAAEAIPLVADASGRRYTRLIQDGAVAILMDADPQTGQRTDHFVTVAHLLAQKNYSAPQIYAHDAEKGLMLLEDLGDGLFVNMLDTMPEQLLYEAATDLLVDFRQLETKGLPLYSTAIYCEEVSRFLKWYCPAIGVAVTESQSAALLDEIEKLCKPIEAAPSYFVYLDYHAENLLWLPKREAHRKIGLLDFQDARAGNPAYDLMSLLQDARRDVSPELEAILIERYLEATNDDPALFKQNYAILGAQRNLKILGIFARMAVERKRIHYLAHMKRVWAYLEHDLKHPACAPLKTWLSAFDLAPTEARINALKDQAA